MFKGKIKKKWIVILVLCAVFAYLVPARGLGELIDCDSVRICRNGRQVGELADPSEYVTVEFDGGRTVGLAGYSVSDVGLADVFRIRTAYTLKFYDHGEKIMSIRMLTIAGGEDRKYSHLLRPLWGGSYLGENRPEERYINGRYIACCYRRGKLFRFVKPGLEKAVEAAINGSN